jgi:hypothetical protein
LHFCELASPFYRQSYFRALALPVSEFAVLSHGELRICNDRLAIFSEERELACMEALEKVLQKRKFTRSISHKVDQEIRERWYEGTVIREKEATAEPQISTPASSLLDVPTRRDDGKAVFRSTDQSEWRLLDMSRPH